MARRAPGLGKKLGDILSETTGGEYGKGQPAPTTSKPLGGLRSLFPSGDDFGPTCVGMANDYYQGPLISTRVAGHQFIPTESAQLDWMNSPVGSGPDGSGQFFDAMQGHIYVLWQSDGKVTRYGPCSLSDYRAFRESNSKGRSVRWLQSLGFVNDWPIGDTELDQCTPSLSRQPRKR